MSFFYMPVKVYEESEVVKNHAEEIMAFGKKALIVTGKSSSRKNGSYDDVVSVLDEKNVSYVVFDDIEENPCVETVMKARDFGVSEGVDFVIGIGGGSAMDAAKAISLMIKHRDEDASYLYSAGADSSTLPIVLIPTTCGTGSEVTAVSVITVPEKKTKKSISHKIFADLALIDGKYLKTAPASVLANTAIDALTHMIESYINTKSTPYSRMCVDAGLRTWRECLPVIKGEKEARDEDYMALMRASMFAGMSIAHTATSIPHGLSYSLTYKLKIPHGKAVGYFTAGYLMKASESDREYILKTAGFESVEDFQKVYLELCGSAEVPDEILIEAVEELSANKAKLALAPMKLSKDDLMELAFVTKKIA